MTLKKREWQEIPKDTRRLGQRLMTPENRYRIIGDQLATLLEDEDFAALYALRGRHALSPAMLALITVFQFLEDLPDRAAAEQLAVRVDWKYALHLPLTYEGFEFSALCAFRARCRTQGAEELIFERVLGVLRERGLVSKRGRQRTDATAVLGAVRQLTQRETVHETLRLSLRALRAADAAWVERTLPASWQEPYLEPCSEYRLSAAARTEGFLRTGRDGFWLLERLAEAPAVLATLPAVALLQTVWAQRFERTAAGEVQQAPEVPCTERVLTPHDPTVRAGEKRGVHWHGEKVHVTETAEEGEPSFITDVTTGNASGGDVQILPTVRARLAARDLLPQTQVVDAGYISGQQLAQSAQAGVTLLGPPLPDTARAELKIADFTLEVSTRTAVCPQGVHATRWRRGRDRDGSRVHKIQFPAAACAGCPLRAQCTTSPAGRSLSVSEHHERLAARRAEAQTEAFKAQMRARPAIEATFSTLVRVHGLRRHRYRGAAQRHMENLLKATACNLKRVAVLLGSRLRAWSAARGPAAAGPPHAITPSRGCGGRRALLARA